MQAQGFDLHENKLQFRHVESPQVDGVKLTDDEREYLLPHFLMLLVGKPGSGKTTLLKQLLSNPQMYYRKFDEVIMVSPSHAKMGIKIKADNCTTRFSLDWLFAKFESINQEQLHTVFGFRAQQSTKTKKTATGKPLEEKPILGDSRARFLLSDAFQQVSSVARHGQNAQTEQQKAAAAEAEKNAGLQKKYDELKKLPLADQQRTHKNVLVVLDDVVGSIKKSEFDPRLAQLVMNRRHIIFNGTISIIMVTQKYSLIPSRVRSNASWLVLYQLNPIDFDTAYKDAVTMMPDKWRQLLAFVFGMDYNRKAPTKEMLHIEEEKKSHEEEKKGDDEMEVTPKLADQLKKKKFENLGIWVESNIYFKNFKRIKL